MSSITLRKGDTLSALARKYGTTVDKLAKANHIKNPDRIIAGKTLSVKDGFEAKGSADAKHTKPGGDSFETKPQKAPQQPQQPQAAQKPQQAQTPQAPQQPQQPQAAQKPQQAQTPQQPQQTQASQKPQQTQAPQQTQQSGNAQWLDTETNRKFESRDGVPIFAQSDKEWGNDRLLGSGATEDKGQRRIANKGCAMSASAMAVSALSGQTITPRDMDRHLDAHGGYDKGSNVVFGKTAGAAKNVTPPITALRAYNQTPADIAAHVAKGQPVVIRVDHTGDGKGDHWMTVTGRNADGSFRVTDPAGGKLINMAIRDGQLVSQGPNDRNSSGHVYKFVGDVTYFSGGNRKLGQGPGTPAPASQPSQAQAPQKPSQTQTPSQTQASTSATRPTAPNGYKSIDPNDFLSLEKGTNSPAAIIIGNAEGTRTPNGGMTKFFAQHPDPGNKKTNMGSFSYQDGKVSNAAEADQAQLRALRGFMGEYKKAANAAGLDSNNALLVAGAFDSFNQGQAAGARFLKQMPYLKEHGVTRDSVVEARIRTWYDPKTQERYLDSKGNKVGGGFVEVAQGRAHHAHRQFRGEEDVRATIKQNQAQRIDEMIKAMKAQGLAPTH